MLQIKLEKTFAIGQDQELPNAAEQASQSAMLQSEQIPTFEVPPWRRKTTFLDAIY
jgi:hypothetical protein